MKRRLICPKCPNGKIGRAKSILDSEHHEVHLGEGRDGPLWGLIGKKHRLRLEAYICTTCGLTETYVKNHEDIKWDAVKNFEWVEVEQAESPQTSSEKEASSEEPAAEKSEADESQQATDDKASE